MAENDWTAALEATGHGVIRGLLGAGECGAILALYEQPERFRSKVVMAKHGYGRGEYQYFANPLPKRVLELRRTLLRYGPGDFNCLHQDLYGPLVFPFQVAVLLSKPGVDFSGGEFVLTQQRPRMQSRVDVVPLEQGDAVAFAVNERPVQGTRGIYRVRMRHGVSEVRSGKRHTLGIIFHDAA